MCIGVNSTCLYGIQIQRCLECIVAKCLVVFDANVVGSSHFLPLQCIAVTPQNVASSQSSKYQLSLCPAMLCFLPRFCFGTTKMGFRLLSAWGCIIIDTEQLCGSNNSLVNFVMFVMLRKNDNSLHPGPCGRNCHLSWVRGAQTRNQLSRDPLNQLAAPVLKTISWRVVCGRVVLTSTV